jgi:hypothetical protein
MLDYWLSEKRSSIRELGRTCSWNIFFFIFSICFSEMVLVGKGDSALKSSGIDSSSKKSLS